ncbi:MAG: GDP-L-fucose synthase [Pseudomonadota bacterium]
MDNAAKIYVAGHAGMVGSALVRRLGRAGFSNLLLRSRRELDLTDQGAVEAFFDREAPDHVFLAAARVGGIMANQRFAADFLYQNLAIQTNVIQAAYRSGVKSLLFLASSCMYPRECPQPIREDYLLTGPFEPTNEAFAVAKIAGVKMCQYYNSQYRTRFWPVIPTNLYGPNDNFDLENSHVVPALIRKFHEAKRANHDAVTLWGTGEPRRELMHVDDLAQACVFVMTSVPETPRLLNIGCGNDIRIADLAELVRRVVGHRGPVFHDASKPDGMPRKLLDSSSIFELGWRPQISLEDGVEQTYQWFLSRTP